MNKHDLLLADKEFLFPAVFHYFQEPLVISHAKDQWVWDADGNQYLDFFAGIVTVSVGHCNDKVNQRVKAQMDRLQHVSTVYVTEPQAQLARKLASISPEGKLTRTMLTNSGTEANETAVVAARCFTGAQEIIALRHSYHGRSQIAMAVTGNAQWRTGGSPQPGIVFAHNAYCYRCPFGLTYPSCDVRCGNKPSAIARILAAISPFDFRGDCQRFAGTKGLRALLDGFPKLFPAHALILQQEFRQPFIGRSIGPEGTARGPGHRG